MDPKTKELTTEQKEKEAKINAFLVDFRELSNRHLLDFQARMGFDEIRGTFPKMTIIDVPAPVDAKGKLLQPVEPIL